MSVAIDERGLLLDGHPLPLVSGDLHYWRHQAKDWPQLLSQVRKLGIRVLCTYIPWSVHESGRGTFDFGDLDPAKNLEGFLDLVADHDLLLLTRPGPHINAELTYFGFPQRLFENQRYLARNAKGGPVILPAMPRAFPVISYAAEAFWQELAGWFDAVAPILARRLYPNGSIIGVQLDNELSYFFRTSAFDQDYHPDAQAKWVAFLVEKYGDEQQAATAHDSQLLPSEQPPPREFVVHGPRDLPRYLDWMEFKERLLLDSMARLRGMWEERGVRDTLFFHNYPICEARTPFNLPAAERMMDFCGVDFYMQKGDYQSLKRKMLFLAGQSRLPVSPEFACGCYQFWPPVEPLDQEFTTKVAWMFGLKGINFYMLVERDRWYGSPITRKGGDRPEYRQLYEKHLALLDRLEPWGLKRQVAVCLLSVRAYERLEGVSNVAAPIPPLLLESRLPLEDLCGEDNFGFTLPIQYLHAKMLRGWETALTAMQIPYVIGSTESDVADLAAQPIIVCPTFDFLDRHTQEKLARYAAEGGILVCGPEVPAYDEAMREHSVLAGFTGRPAERLDSEVDTLVCPAGKGRIILITEVPTPPEAYRQTAQTVCRYLGLKSYYPVTPPCETSLHLGENGRRILYVANPTAARHRAKIEMSAPGELLTDLENGDRFYGDAYFEIDLPAYAVRILEVR